MRGMGFRLVLAVMVVFGALSAEAAYGIKWTPGDDAVVAGAYLTAENAFELRMRQPDGKVRQFYRDFDQPNKLYGEEPWVGEDLGGGTFSILTNPEFKGGRTMFIFQNGHLRRMVLGRKDHNFASMPFPASTNSLQSLWPKPLTEAEMSVAFGTWTGDAGRLRLGYANPNKAGCLCAELALLGLALLLLSGRSPCMAAGAILAAAAFFVLTKTESRSAFVAFSVGAMILAVFRIRSLFTWRRFAVVAGIVGVCVAIIAYSGVAERFTTGLVDVAGETDAFRVKVWHAAPKMMVDSPDGWGLGMSGVAYTSWYQPVVEFRAIRTLVNSHLTWLVEFGWVGRFLYLAAIFGFLVLAFLAAWRKFSPLPFAMFALLFTAGLFNSVMEAPTLWIIPVVSLLPLAVDWRKAFTLRSALISICVGAAMSLLTLAVLAVIGSRSESVPALKAGKCMVVVNGKSAKTWVVDDNVVLGKGFLGRELRMYYAAFPEEPSLGIAWDVADVPDTAEHLVVAGRKCEDFLEALSSEPELASKFSSITFISPPFHASAVPENLASNPGFLMLQGELAARMQPEDGEAPRFLKVIPGAELYIPGWMKMVAERGKKISEQQK